MVKKIYNMKVNKLTRNKTIGIGTSYRLRGDIKGLKERWTMENDNMEQCQIGYIGKLD